MTPLHIKLLRLAKEDLRDAHLWYESQTSGEDFLHEVTTALRKAAAQPLQFPIVDRNLAVRRVLVKRFPYKAFFTVETTRIVVHAIIDARRSSRTWQDRIR